MLDVAAGHRRYFGSKTFKFAYALLKIIRQPLVISIEKSDELAASLRQPCIARRAWPGVRLTNHTKARVRIAGDNRRALISRAIINDDCFEVCERLRSNRVERPPHVRRFVVKRNDD